MFKYVLWLMLFTLQTSFAQSNQMLNLQNFIEADTEVPGEDVLDIAYQHIIPQYEENQDPEREVALEFYHSDLEPEKGKETGGADTASSKNLRKIEWIKELIADDRKLSSDYALEVIVIGPHGMRLDQSEEIEDVISKLEVKNVDYQNLPEGVGVSGQERTPSSVEEDPKKPSKFAAFAKDERIRWTFIRGATGSGAVFASLVLATGVDPATAAAAAVVPGLVSGAITYHSGTFGNWLTNERWSKWLMESGTKFAQKMRKQLVISVATLQKYTNKTKASVAKKFPRLFAMMPEVYEKEGAKIGYQKVKKAKLTLSDLKAKLGKLKPNLFASEELIKWWVTEVAFTAVAFKAPQHFAGISVIDNLSVATKETLIGSTMGFFAQGPGDIAVQVRKYQKIDELKKKVLAGEIENSKKLIPIGKTTKKGEKPVLKEKTLLEEIEMVLAKEGEYKTYSIGNDSHKLLQKIENSARARATMLSFFSVAGVGLEVAGAKTVARSVLISLGVGGGLYLAHVKGIITVDASKKLVNMSKAIFKGTFKGIKGIFSRKKKANLSGLDFRYCKAPFVMP